MIFVVIAWIFILMTMLLLRAWMESPTAHSTWPRVRIVSGLMMTASFFFLFLHFASPAQEKHLESDLLKHHHILIKKNNMTRTNVSMDRFHSVKNRTQVAFNSTIVRDMMLARV